MGKPTGFVEIERRTLPARPVAERLRDWKEVYLPVEDAQVADQAARCMDCGIPFCHQGCPLGNVIPDWTDLVYRNQWRAAAQRLSRTNNFPEFTGRLCPALCEASCVLGMNGASVAIRSIELAIVEHAFEQGWIAPAPPLRRTGRRVGIIGSGPAGLACADQLNRAGHWVEVFERDDRVGGLLRYGIPEFKLEKRILDRRLAILVDEGIVFHTSTDVGVDVDVPVMMDEFDAIVLACGAREPRDLPIPGREFHGIHFAMEYLTQQNRCCHGDQPESAGFIDARGKRVVIIGGGDTGADCLGTALRQGALSAHQFELLPRPPDERTPDNPWPQWPNVFRVSSAHEEGGERLFSVATEAFSGDHGRVTRLHGVLVDRVQQAGHVEFRPVRGTEFQMDVDLVLLAMGFVGPSSHPLMTKLGVTLTDRGTVWRDSRGMTSVPGVFTAGDAHRGQSLVVWAIADGRRAAQAVDTYLAAPGSQPMAH